MSSDEDEELAQLRAQRAARLGPGETATLSQLREKQRLAQSSRSAADVLADRAGSDGRQAAGGQSDEDEDGPVVVDEDAAQQQELEADEEEVQEGLRGHLPMFFGKQEVQVAKLQEVHDKTKRKGPAVGPPRPPAVGPPRPPTHPSHAAPSTSGAVEAAAEELTGPPRPQAGGSPGGSAGARDGGWSEGVVGPPRPAGSGGDDDGPPARRRKREEGRALPGGTSAAVGEEEEEEAEQQQQQEEEEEDEEDPYLLPVTHEVALAGHERAVVALDVDHSGSRVVTGSLDYTVRLYDFAGMKSDLRSFRELTPHDGHPVHAVSWSPSGDAFIAVTGATQAKVYDRDGKERGEFVRGDMYIRDMKNTKGHVSGLTYGQWHPTDRYTAATSSEDGTVRIWDTWNIQQKTVIKPVLAKPGRVSVTTCAYNSDGRLLAAGLMDGTIQVWSVTGKFGTSAAIGAIAPPKPQLIEKQAWSYVSRAGQVVRDAHEPQTEVTSLAFSQDDHTLASRGLDGTLKLWDLRKFKEPAKVYTGLPANYATTKVTFSPDEKLLLTGTAAKETREGVESGGTLVFVDVERQSIVRHVGFPSHVTCMTWHHRLNQILVGIGDRKGGSTCILYDTNLSERGVLQCVGRQPRRASPFDFTPPLVIKTFGALPLFREEQKQKRKREDGRAKVPDLGAAAGVGRAGRIGTTGGTLLTQHLMKQRGKLVAPKDELDARAAMLRHADTKDDSISRLTQAYQKTQPKPIFAEPDDEEES